MASPLSIDFQMSCLWCPMRPNNAFADLRDEEDDERPQSNDKSGGLSVLMLYRDYVSPSVAIGIYSSV
jgi:hypothetical protein